MKKPIKRHTARELLSSLKSALFVYVRNALFRFKPATRLDPKCQGHATTREAFTLLLCGFDLQLIFLLSALLEDGAHDR